jgi:hypothetical protein
MKHFPNSKKNFLASKTKFKMVSSMNTRKKQLLVHS